MKRGRPKNSALDRALDAWGQMSPAERLAFKYIADRYEERTYSEPGDNLLPLLKRSVEEARTKKESA